MQRECGCFSATPGAAARLTPHKRVCVAIVIVIWLASSSLKQHSSLADNWAEPQMIAVLGHNSLSHED